MDEKTAELREIFLEATGEEHATERQTDPRGSLVGGEAEAVEERLADLVATMRERYGFGADLSDDAYRRVVRLVHEEGVDDAAVADALDTDPETIRRARLDLHLVRETDRGGPEFDAVRDRIVDGEDDTTVADALDTDPETVARAREVVQTELETVRANHRFRDEFAELLTDDDLAAPHARDAREDGLRAATEDIETDVSL
jgi:hypothetical protein